MMFVIYRYMYHRYPLPNVYCLVDVSICRDSGFEILSPLSEATAHTAYCPAYRIGGSSGFDKTLKLAGGG